jgi:hypothetical protein
VRQSDLEKRLERRMGLVSKPIGGGNSKTVIIGMATVAPTAPILDEGDPFALLSISDTLPEPVAFNSYVESIFVKALKVIKRLC